MSSTTQLQTLSASQASPEVPLNEIVETLSAGGIFGKNHPACTGLTFGVLGGLYNGNTVANQTVTLTNAADNYVVVLRSSGVVSVSTATTNWNSASYARLYKATTSGGVVTALVDHRQDTKGLLFIPPSIGVQCIPIAVGDETTNCTAGADKVKFRMPFAFTLTAVRASLNTAATGATLFQVDIKESGTTILSTKLTFDASEKTTTTATTPAVISDTALADDAEISIDIDAIGNTIPGNGLKVYLIGSVA